MKLKMFLMGAIVLSMTACNNDKSSKSEDENTEENSPKETAVVVQENTPVVAAGNLKIAYIFTDSLIANYQGFVDANQLLRDKKYDLEQEMLKTENSLKARANKLQKTFDSGVYVERELMAANEKLQKDQLYYQDLYGKKSQEVQIMEQRAAERQLSKISEYIDRFALENNYDFIFQRPQGILFGKQSYNVTASVLEVLNNEYNNDSSAGDDLETITELDSLK